jgi:hypothetical protein
MRIADFVAAVLVENRSPETVRREVLALRADYQSVGYCFDAPPAS